MITNPRQDVIERTLVRFQHPDNELFAFVGAHRQPPSIQAKKNVSRKERDAFVAIDERVIDQQRFEKRGRHLFDMCVIAGLWTEEGAFEQTRVTNTVHSAEAIDQALLDREHFVKGKKLNNAIGQAGCPVLRFPG